MRRQNDLAVITENQNIAMNKIEMILSDSETLENNYGSIIPEKNIRHCLNIHEKTLSGRFKRQVQTRHFKVMQ